MKDAGTTKNAFLASNPSISLSYSFRVGSVFENCFNSSEIDSKFIKRSFSVISVFITIQYYIFNYLLSIEAVINSVMHKYYFEHGHNNILRFLSNRIRIENYWQKPSHFVLGETVFRRNRIIADLFSKINFGEKMGTGFERIQEICTKENAPFPEIHFNEDYFYVTFRQSHEYLELAVKADVKDKEEIILNERQQKSIEYVRSQGYISISEYISLNKVSDKTARRDLAYLVTKRIFKKEGVTTDLRFKLASVSSGQLRSQDGPNA